MVFGLVTLEKRIKENIKNYSLEQLLDRDTLSAYLKAVSAVSGLSFLLVDRHGEWEVCVGDFDGFQPDVVNAPGQKIRVSGRTVGHLYTKPEELEESCEKQQLVEAIVCQLTQQARKSYESMETALYADELEQRLEKEHYQVKHGEKKDPLTGVLNSTYFENRSQVIDRSDVVPVAVICANINDWKRTNDKYGDEESDRLIKTVARIIRQEARDEYVIGRSGGDFFHILIPLVEEGEAEDYCRRVQEACHAYQDDRIMPSVACGCVFKTNVEQTISRLLTDAEYEMYHNKLEMKSAPEYQARFQTK